MSGPWPWMDAELAGEPSALDFQGVRIYAGPGIARRLVHEIHGLHRYEAAELVRRINAPNVAAGEAEQWAAFALARLGDDRAALEAMIAEYQDGRPRAEEYAALKATLAGIIAQEARIRSGVANARAVAVGWSDHPDYPGRGAQMSAPAVVQERASVSGTGVLSAEAVQTPQ